MLSGYFSFFDFIFFTRIHEIRDIADIRNIRIIRSETSATVRDILVICEIVLKFLSSNVPIIIRIKLFENLKTVERSVVSEHLFLEVESCCLGDSVL